MTLGMRRIQEQKDNGKGNSLENYPCLVSSLQFPYGICLMGLYLSLLTFPIYLQNLFLYNFSKTRFLPLY